MKTKLVALFVLFISLCSSSEIPNRSDSLNIIYIHGAMNSSKKREKEFPNDAKSLHNAFRKTLGETKPFSRYRRINSTVFYWGDLLRDDAEQFSEISLKKTLRNSEGIINTALKGSLMPIAYDAEWLQDQEKLSEVLTRLNQTIKDKNEPFVLMSHSAGTLLAFDFLTLRLSYFELRNKISKEYNLDQRLREKLPEYSCKELIDKYDPKIAKITAKEISFLKDAFNEVAVSLLSKELNEAKKLLNVNLRMSQQKLKEIENNAKSPVCIAIAPKIKKHIQEDIRIKSLLENQYVFYDMLVLAKIKQEEQIKDSKKLLEDAMSEVSKLAKYSVRPLSIKQEEQDLVEHLKFFISSEEQSLASLNKLLDTKPGEFSSKVRAHSETLVNEIIEDHQQLCISADKFAGFMTFGSPIPLFRDQHISKYKDENSLMNNLLKEIYFNKKFWINLNHAADPVAISIPNEVFVKHFRKDSQKRLSGFIHDGMVRDKAAKIFKCTGPQAKGCTHEWYWQFPENFCKEIKKVFDEQ